MNRKTLTDIFAVIYFLSAILFAVSFYQKHWGKDPLIENIQVSPVELQPKESLIDAINNLPDGSFKANLMTVVGAEYNGDSDQLNEILNAYAKLKIKEIEKKNQL